MPKKNRMKKKQKWNKLRVVNSIEVKNLGNQKEWSTKPVLMMNLLLEFVF